MLLLRFFHDENLLFVGDKEYKATCPVRNELNGERRTGLPKTFPADGSERKEYQPRKFPTGWWKVKPPIWTNESDYAPVKIPTDATRRVLTKDGTIQVDAFYHLHYAGNSLTTLGCIRLNSAEEAAEIAKTIEAEQKKGNEVWIEVIASRKCERK